MHGNVVFQIISRSSLNMIVVREMLRGALRRQSEAQLKASLSKLTSVDVTFFFITAETVLTG